MVRTYTGHSGPVTCVSLSGERLITGGEDCEIRIMTFSEDVKTNTSFRSALHRRHETPA
jgi:WD40 repeat protein